MPIRAPASAEGPYRFHPGLLDSCLQWLCVMGPRILFGDAAEQRRASEIYVPFHVETLELWGSPARSQSRLPR